MRLQTLIHRGTVAVALSLVLFFATTSHVASSAGEGVANAGVATSRAESEAEDAAAVARDALARLPAEARLGEIKNERLRRAVQVAYRAVVELAENRDPAKVAALNLKFERAYAGVRRETARGEFEICADNCQGGDGEPCLMKCKTARKKFCGCKIIVFGCLVAECIF